MASPEREGGSGQSPAMGRLWQGLAIAAGIALLVALGSNSAQALQGALFGLAMGSFAVVIWLWKRGRRHLAPGGAEALASDPRPPILYLRSFASEDAISVEEEALARVMAELGPFVAIGRPGERLPPLGASRFYVPGSDWQGFVLDLMRKARLVLVAAGATPGLGWEIKRCVETIAPEKVLILVPASVKTYEQFRSIAAREADLVLPALLQPSRLGGDATGFQGVLHFDNEWGAAFHAFDRPIAGLAATDQREDRLRSVLAPALATIGLKIGPRRRNIRDELQSALNVWLVVAALAAGAGLIWGLWALAHGT